MITVEGEDCKLDCLGCVLLACLFEMLTVQWNKKAVQESSSKKLKVVNFFSNNPL